MLEIVEGKLFTTLTVDGQDFRCRVIEVDPYVDHALLGVTLDNADFRAAAQA
jgi:hypothetical protein